MKPKMNRGDCSPGRGNGPAWRNHSLSPDDLRDKILIRWFGAKVAIAD
jgi:hypothetical protein